MANRKEKVEAVTDFIFLGSKITVDGDCSHKFKRLLLLGRKAMTNLDSILKSINSSALSLLYGLISHLDMITGKTTVMTIRTLVGKVMPLLFYTLCLS